MSDYYLDSSTLVKRYVQEVGTAWVQGLTNPTSPHTIITSAISEVEVISAAWRLVRMGTLPSQDALRLRQLLQTDILRFALINPDQPLRQLAQDLLERHPLRAYDAVQLASALAAHRRLQANGLTGLIFVAADHRLLVAATAEGLTTDDPTLHP